MVSATLLVPPPLRFVIARWSPLPPTSRRPQTHSRPPFHPCPPIPIPIPIPYPVTSFPLFLSLSMQTNVQCLPRIPPPPSQIPLPTGGISSLFPPAECGFYSLLTSCSFSLVPLLTVLTSRFSTIVSPLFTVVRIWSRAYHRPILRAHTVPHPPSLSGVAPPPPQPSALVVRGIHHHHHPRTPRPSCQGHPHEWERPPLPSSPVPSAPPLHIIAQVVPPTLPTSRGCEPFPPSAICGLALAL